MSKRFGYIGLVFLFVLAAAPVFAGINSRPFQLSLFSPVQIIDEDMSVNGLRLNLIYSKNRGMTGFDLGLVNQVEQDFQGVGMAAVTMVGGDATGFLICPVGLGNFVNGNMAGAQFTYIGVGNWVNGEGACAQSTMIGAGNYADQDVLFQSTGIGVGNITKADAYGQTIGFGVCNVAQNINGMQFAVADLFNYTALELNGLQAGAVVNFTGDRVNGLQIGAVNMSPQVTGMQIGIVNYTDMLDGLQIGLVNMAMGKDHWTKVLPLINAAW
ncbi:MAG: hypothetical protein EOM20_03090 [Spartobacteria bacterium]|nr:hypothetical protein [Spartobacteria bacterium]